MVNNGKKGLSRRDFLKFSSMLAGAGLIAARPMPTLAKKVFTLDDIPLDATEIHHLEFIREEEKLARDVYIKLYQKWDVKYPDKVKIFDYIADSEQMHMDAMLFLLDTYGIEDPVGDNDIGVFTDDYIQGLYDDLTVWGNKSLDNAFLVGGFIEEYDILDIWKAVNETDEKRCDKVYTNLYKGSYNHLHGYVKNWEGLTKETYVPQLMEEKDYLYCMDYETDARQQQERK
jgi:hypothetical protein